MTFDELNAVDSRSGEFKNGADPENRRSTCLARAPRATGLRGRRSGSGALPLQSMIGNTALIIARMFRDRRTLRQ
jgi:hypothetical protein